MGGNVYFLFHQDLDFVLHLLECPCYANQIHYTLTSLCPKLCHVLQRVREAARHYVFLSTAPFLELLPYVCRACWIWICDNYRYKVPLCSFTFFTLHSVLVLVLPCFFIYFFNAVSFALWSLFLLVKKKKGNLPFW